MTNEEFLQLPLSYFTEKRKDANKFNPIREHARRIVCKDLKQVCQHCNYDKHVEVCHIKSISSFLPNSLVKDINALSNLILLCPNCHWEFDNEERLKKLKESQKCPCGSKKYKTSERCQKCANQSRQHRPEQHKVPHPSKEELEKLIKITTFKELGKKFGVSDNTVRKWCKKYSITIPDFGRGFWAKVKAGKVAHPAGIEPVYVVSS